MRNPALGQVVRCLSDEALADRISGQSAVAIGVGRVGRHGEGRVAHDEIELLAGDRFVQASLPQLDGTATVQEPVEVGELERAPVHIGCDDAFRVPDRCDGLNATAGAEVERRVDRATERHVREQESRRRGPDNVLAPAATGAVAHKHEIAGRNQLHLRDDGVPANLDEAARLRGSDRQR